MRRIALSLLFLAGALWPQQQKDKQPPKPKPQQQEQEPPEEDESLKPKEYPFNPLEAENDVKVGNYYFKKGNYKAALNRFREATRFNPGYAVAYMRMGDAEEKLKDKPAAKEAYAKYLELAPDSRDAPSIKKKLAN